MAQTVNWFPGHMAKTLRAIGDRLRQVDAVIETCDARIPVSSRNPELDRLIGDKPRLLLLGKEDLADPVVTAEWIAYFRHMGIPAVACDNTRRNGVDSVRRACLEMSADRIARAREKGRVFRPARAMVVGIPNTGKSTLINSLAGRASTRTEDRPGVTRNPQWVRTEDGLELMDMPGVLWADLGDRTKQMHLAATGAIKDDILDIEEIAEETLADLIRTYPAAVTARYKAERLDLPIHEQLDDLARRRGCILSGGRVDRARFAAVLLDELRSGRIGRISLERPEAKVRP
ncbi:MAG: ribosome biogenesis GTPase YlqF [Clostridia bacterium]|nr:ribosome biogenesis GTPase YlqF [Clostridia bacterium]